MRFIIGGRTIDINSLTPGLDAAFISLHAAYFGHGTLNWDDFEAQTTAFLDANPSPSSAHDAYFNNFTVIWNAYLASRSYQEAERTWQLALEPVFKWEAANPGKRIHKGTAYYFWGMTALQSADLDKGYALMHQAAEEDVLTVGTQVPDTPAMAFANLNYEKADQAFRQWVLAQANYLNVLQNNYSATYSRPFLLDDFKIRFLHAPPSTEALFLFAYVVAKLMRLSSLPPHIRRSRFAGQLELNVFFDLTLVIDAAVKHKAPGKWRFIDLAETLLAGAGAPLSNAQLRMVNSVFETDFDRSLQRALNGTLSLQDGTALSGLQLDVAVAYGLRNHGAHDVASASTIWQEFHRIQQALHNVLFATVDHLY